MQNDCNKDGFLVVFKPSGCTSRDVVNKVSKLLGTKKIGHTGTLDPIATGVLVLTIGKYTKFSDYLTSKFKDYEAEFTFGYETDTLDYTGVKTFESSKKVTREDLERCLNSLKGTYLQEVPLYSAIKVDGKKLYEYGRCGIDVELPKRQVVIEELSLQSFSENRVKIKCTVSKGTYIRSLIRDIGRSLGTYATMTRLERTMQGGFKKEDSYTLEEIEFGKYHLLSLEEVLDMEELVLDDETAKKVLNGVKLEFSFQSEFIKCTLDGKLVAIYKKEGNIYRMFIKF